MRVHLGVDVGGTNTDAVVIHDGQVVASAKHVTTGDVTRGLCGALTRALNSALVKCQEIQENDCLSIHRVHIGTTHFVNAVLQRTNLAKVGILRLCGPATTALPPLCDFPDDLRKVVHGDIRLLDGGFEFDGQKEIRPFGRTQLDDAIQGFKDKGIQNIVVSGVFSPVNPKHEDQVAAILDEVWPGVTYTLSHKVGQLGLLERENAAILNEALRPLADKTIAAIREGLDQLGIYCPFYLTQNDGTLISAEQAVSTPVYTFASGPTNSMRGAAFLSGETNALVMDIGGTSTDVGILKNGFPRQAATKVKVGGVVTNFRMPDVLSVALGGGSIVEMTQEMTEPQIGPKSTGYELTHRALVFGGQDITASDVAVAAGLATMGTDPDKASRTLSKQLVNNAMKKMKCMFQDAIDLVRTSSSAIPLILVGGGSILVNKDVPFDGISEMIEPDHHSVANAVGAALSQVSATLETIVCLDEDSRQTIIEQNKAEAVKKATAAGAEAGSIKILDLDIIPLSYIPGNATRLHVKAIGDLSLTKQNDEATSVWDASTRGAAARDDTQAKGALNVASLEPLPDTYLEAKEPYINASGEWELSAWDIEALAVGAGILSCGGGGSPYLNKIVCQQLLREGKKMRVVTPESWSCNSSDHDLVVPMAMMGAPTILIERLESSKEMMNAFNGLSYAYELGPGQGEGVTYIDRTGTAKLTALCSAEIGGSNGLSALALGARLDMPVVDCDLMGRAFPELQHCVPFIYGSPPYPSCLADYNNNTNITLHTTSPKALENHYRGVCMSMGCAAALAIPGLTKDKLPDLVIHHSVSRAWRLGEAVLRARCDHADPISTILEHSNGNLIFMGKVSDVERQTTGGFAKGKVSIKGAGNFGDMKMNVEFQNENLMAFITRSNSDDREVVACVPDLICIAEQESGEPIATEEVRFGVRVAVLVLPAAPPLTTPQALTVVGPEAFGYTDYKYTPHSEKYDKTDPVGPK